MLENERYMIVMEKVFILRTKARKKINEMDRFQCLNFQKIFRIIYEFILDKSLFLCQITYSIGT
eukprot:UN05490